jgi:dTDP-4-amino-4,6-dideoxygalactose transaminase
VVEDAAQAIDAYHNNQPLGSFGDVGILSFHESKNIVSGEGGLCTINNDGFIERAEILWEKGTNRQAFNRGQVDKYSWVDVGSSFLPSDMIAAFLLGQLENLHMIQEKRVQVWERYYEGLNTLHSEGYIQLPRLPDYATNNAHMFYFLLNDAQTQKNLLQFLNQKGIKAIFHYIPLHSSPYFEKKAPDIYLPNTDRISSTIVRLPLFCELTLQEQDYIIKQIFNFFKGS